jgi:hypothetical protein
LIEEPRNGTKNDAIVATMSADCRTEAEEIPECIPAEILRRFRARVDAWFAPAVGMVVSKSPQNVGALMAPARRKLVSGVSDRHVHA